MKVESFSDDYLIDLHRKQKMNSFFVLYNRYRKYGYTIVCNQFRKYNVLNALNDEKDSIVYEAINEAMESYDKDKGNFKTLFSNIVYHKALKCIVSFSKDPLSDYVSLDDDRKVGDELVFMDSGIYFNPKKNKEFIDNEIVIIKKYYKGHYQRRILRMIEMKRDGFSFNEIGKRYQMSGQAVRAIFYRLKIRINKNKNK